MNRAGDRNRSGRTGSGENPSIAKELVKEPTPSAFQEKVLKVITPRLTHELERMIKSIDGKAHMAPGQLAAGEST